VLQQSSGPICLTSSLIQTPLCPERLVLPLWLGELEAAGLLRHHRALLLGLQAGHQLRDQAAGLLGVQVTRLLGYVHQGVYSLIMAFLWPLLSDTACSTDIEGNLLTLGVSNELAWSLPDVLGGA